ncbi:Xylose isomerase domain-containing protein TIM barrel [[Clostridium] ultunense Esp]|nr:Xylose isomerase domain-containing protein TIM barrel [[Clostridium] ultunense Esp]
MNACTFIPGYKSNVEDGMLEMEKRIPIGLQLYTLRNELQQDFWGTLNRVSEMGYETVEMAGYYGLSAKELKEGLREIGLTAISSHVGFSRLNENLEEEILYAKELGISYLVCPYLAPEQLEKKEERRKVALALKQIAEKCREHGLMFAYHNHAHEMKEEEGKRILDRLFEEADASSLQAELDLYWVKKGEADPMELMERYKSRLHLLHIKDMAPDEEKSFAEVGQGIMDYPSIFAKALEYGVRHYIVEQDLCKRPPLQSVEMSIQYLKSLGLTAK